MKLLGAMATVGGLTAVSRVFGFLRDILTAAMLGAGPIADAFFVALKLPNLFRRITAEGAFSVSFVPLYTEKLERENLTAATGFSAQALAIMIAVLLPFTLLAMIAMPFVLMAIAPGFEPGQERYELAVTLSRITFPYLMLMSISSLIGAVLNAHHRFAPFAAAPILFNLCLCGALLVGTDFLPNAGYALAWGVFAAGILQLMWLYICLKHAGFSLPLVRPKMTTDIKRLFKLMGPGVIGAGVVHINLFADIIIASFLATGSISYLYYADRLNQLPLGIVGIAVGTALLPMLSRSIAAKNIAQAQHLYNRALEICLVLALPAAAALATIAPDIIRVLFERGEFGPEQTAQTARVLMGYAVGLPAYIVVKVLSSAFWAQQDTATPVKVSILCTILNIILALMLIKPLGVAGIALATGIVGWVQLTLLWQGLRFNALTQFDARFKRTAPKVIIATCAMAVALLGLSYELQPFLTGSSFERIASLVALVAGGSIIYAAGILLTRAMTFTELKTYLKRK